MLRFSARALLAMVIVLAACGKEPSPRVSTPTGNWPVAVEFAPDAAPRYERVILVTIDTLRADHVSVYGYPRATTPFLDSLAERGVLFTRAHATISHTAPSHSSLLTGLPPLVHGVLHNGYQMSASALDLARVFAAAGFETAAAVNTEFLQGVARSFQSLRWTVERGETVVAQAREWLVSERKGPRFFLWVHLFDPHHWKGFALEVAGERLYRGKTPSDFRDSVLRLHGLSGDGAPALVGQHWDTEVKKPVTIESVEQYLRFVDAYDNLIQYADRQVQALYETVDALELPGPTLWIVTSDHGEGLASHGQSGHGGHIYQEQLAVPFLLHASDGSLGPRRVEALVTHLDLFPTLVEALGGVLRAPGGLLEGRSLWPLVRGEAPDWSDRMLFAQRKPLKEGLFALRGERFKLLDAETGADELYDLARDPQELVDVSAARESERERLARELERRRALYSSYAQTESSEIPEEWQQELRDLGYVGDQR